LTGPPLHIINLTAICITTKCPGRTFFSRKSPSLWHHAHSAPLPAGSFQAASANVLGEMLGSKTGRKTACTPGISPAKSHVFDLGSGSRLGIGI